MASWRHAVDPPLVDRQEWSRSIALYYYILPVTELIHYYHVNKMITFREYVNTFFNFLPIKYQMLENQVCHHKQYDKSSLYNKKFGIYLEPVRKGVAVLICL